MYAKYYSRVVRYYGESAWESFKKRMDAEPSLRWGTHPEAPTVRPIIADAYQDHTGDEEGAALIRNHQQHIMLNSEGKPVKARFDFDEMPLIHLHDYLTQNDQGEEPNLPHVAVYEGGIHGHPYGTVLVGHDRSDIPVHFSELGHHLATTIRAQYPHITDPTFGNILRHISRQPFEFPAENT